MVNLKGLASYCQDCGACAATIESALPKNLDDVTIDRIVDEIVKSVQGPTETYESESGLPLIPLGVSNRHVHITRETFQKLFGENSDLEVYRNLYQPDEFAARQVVTIAGSKMRAIQNVRILGPFRNYDQVELSLTDAIGLGIKPPVRNSGDLKDAEPLTLIGPKGSVYLESCAIIANRHLHMTSKDAELYNVSDGDFCKICIGGVKSTIFENVLVRINDNWKLQMHLDTDDANAANVRCQTGVKFCGKM